MRVIAGSKRRLQLQTVPGMTTRPTTDRIKETLFNMIGNDVYHCRFLDLFAGSGQMGIEALSRGASYACFVEKDKGALACIRQNLAHTDFTNESDVMPGDVLICLRGIEGAEAFDIIFIDPPYQLGVERQVLETINQYGLLHEDGYIILEAALETDFSFLEQMPYEIIKEKCYKTNKHLFITKQ